MIRTARCSGRLCLRASRRAPRQSAKRSYNFASAEYASAFTTPPRVDAAKLRADAIAYLEAFQAAAWYDDPVCTIVDGVALMDGEERKTVNAFDAENGAQIMATADVVDRVIRHVRTPRGAQDNRDAVRRIEGRLLSEHAGFLIGNQAVDFGKQDGITEIEEAIEANAVEHALNDQLLAAESRGELSIGRDVALVGCVSNFSNFLDLCRKTLRNIELGVPVLVLSRSNTTQHMYRWTQLLLGEMRAEGLDPALVTYLSCTVPEQRRVMAALPRSPLYLTGSRDVARAIKELLPNTFSSTGGPNTMVAPRPDADVLGALRRSATIENAGQCTAMRHLVTDAIELPRLRESFSGVPSLRDAAEAIRGGHFDGLFAAWGAAFEAAEGYETLGADSAQRVALRVRESLPEAIEEHWRRVYLDVTAWGAGSFDAAGLRRLARWLRREQPITLAVNDAAAAAEGRGDFDLARALFEQTALVVYSVGRPGAPALTCQARPQDGEVFGELPPRREMARYTRSPVVVPSSTPAYSAAYTEDFLAAAARRCDERSAEDSAPAERLLRAVSDAGARGYGQLVLEYLAESCETRRGGGERTALWGLQRPPLGGVHTVLRAEGAAHLDALALALLPFLATNAAEGLVVSVDAAARDSAAFVRVADACEECGVEAKLQTAEECDAIVAEEEPWNVVAVDGAGERPLVGHFVSAFFPLGHIKSTRKDDEDFLRAFRDSPKWLRPRPRA